MCSEGKEMRGNAFLDEILREIVYERDDEYDPYVLEDNCLALQRKILIVNAKYDAQLFNSCVTGMKTLHRADECSLVEENGMIYVTSELGAGVLNIRTSRVISLMNIGTIITFYCKIHYIGIHMEFSVCAKTGRNGMLHKLDINDLRGMTLGVSGFGLLNLFFNIFLAIYTKFFSKAFQKLLQRKLYHHICNRMPSFQFPVERISGTKTLPEEVAPNRISIIHRLLRLQSLFIRERL